MQENSSFSQIVALPSAGTYTLSWSDSGRSGYGVENYQVSFGGVVVDSLQTQAGQACGAHAITVTSTGGPQLLAFEGPTTQVDATAFVDNVSLTAAVPQPSTWAMMAGGMLSLGMMARRRRS